MAPAKRRALPLASSEGGCGAKRGSCRWKRRTRCRPRLRFSFRARAEALRPHGPDAEGNNTSFLGALCIASPLSLSRSLCRALLFRSPSAWSRRLVRGPPPSWADRDEGCREWVLGRLLTGPGGRDGGRHGLWSSDPCRADGAGLAWGIASANDRSARRRDLAVWALQVARVSAVAVGLVRWLQHLVGAEAPDAAAAPAGPAGDGAAAAEKAPTPADASPPEPKKAAPEPAPASPSAAPALVEEGAAAAAEVASPAAVKA
jgi:hypothetical protein